MSQFEKNEPQYVIEQIEIHRYAFLCVYFYDNFFSMWFKRILEATNFQTETRSFTSSAVFHYPFPFKKNEPQYGIEQIEIHRYAFLCVYFYDNFFSMWFKRILEATNFQTETLPFYFICCLPLPISLYLLSNKGSMTIHKEGYKTIALSTIIFGIVNVISFYFLSSPLPLLSLVLFASTLGLLIFLISFFRIPNRQLTIQDNAIIAPADGKVVVIEEVQADEYFTDRRMQVSIFMSPLNVHVNRNPVSGEVLTSVYHKGKYLVAWHPKSSTENERHSVVYRSNGKEILVKQIAGAVAKRICNYLQPGQQVKQTDEMGFIKFGSRVDLLLPLDAKILVNIGDKPKGGVTVIATW